MLTKIWRLTPEQIANYRPGMDLGEPHEVVDLPVIIIENIMSANWRAEIKKRMRNLKRVAITPGEYADYREDGYTDKEIAKMFGISPETLRVYKNKWLRDGIAL